MNVLLYQDRGTAPNAVRQTYLCLKEVLGHAYDIIRVDARVLRCEPWEDACAMVVVPGGRDLPYCEDLHGLANERLRRYVANGGRYLGICAGAYYASSSIEFEKNDPVMRICGARELAFFPGVSRGAIYPGFVYNSERGARAVPILLEMPYFKKERVDVYYNGGGYFVHADAQHDNVRVLARYADPGACDDEPHPAAIVHCTVGQGHAVLMGVHPEYSADMADFTAASSPVGPPHNSPTYAAIVRALIDSRMDRHAMLRAIFQQIGLKTRKIDQFENLEEENDTRQPLFLAFHAQTAVDAWPLLERQWHEAIDPTRGILACKHHDFYLGDTIPQQNDAKHNEDSDNKPLIHLVPPQQEQTEPWFDLAAFFAALDGQRRALCVPSASSGNVLLCSTVVDSTQSLLHDNYTFTSLFPDGTVCVAAHQQAGQGRGRNSWISQAGALQFSLLQRHGYGQPPLVFLQYLLAVAVVDSVRSRPGYEDVPLHLKWPNDVYVRYAGQLFKVGGILVNTTTGPDSKLVAILGCGLNVSNSDPTVSLNQVIHAHNPRLASLTLEDTLAGILAAFDALYATFCTRGMDHWFLDKYYRYWLHSNQVITLAEHDHAQVLVRGISKEHGFLVALDVGTGRVYELQPDGNSFDMMKNMISIKK
ncbi:biotin-protein ligase [Gongronella butleri]|nr:biotin-protein ligase [Gongronella butleri]